MRNYQSQWIRLILAGSFSLALGACGGGKAASEDVPPAEDAAVPATQTSTTRPSSSKADSKASANKDKSETASGKTTEVASADQAPEVVPTPPPAAPEVIVAPTPAKAPSAPSAPVVTVPSVTPFLSQATEFTLSGQCQKQADVIISGDLQVTDMVAPSGQLQIACDTGTFSFKVRKAASGSYAFQLKSSDPVSGLMSAAVSIVWNLDITAPDAPTLQIPAAHPYSSGSGAITLSGACETGATVYLNGASNQSMVCGDGAFSFEVIKTADGSHEFQIHQDDPAGNTSGSTPLRWILDSSVPPAVTLTQPVSNPIKSSASSLLIAGTCQESAIVRITGDLVANDMLAPVGQQTVSCVASQFSFLVAKSSDGIYHLNVIQTNPINGFSSAATSVAWTRDTQPPASLVLGSPSTNPYFSSGDQVQISGSCETDAVVTISGAATHTLTCSDGSFSANVEAVSDGSYSYTLKQNDAVGNGSPALSFLWTRFTPVAPAAPVITAPHTLAYLSKGPNLTLAGTCQAGTTVVIRGDVTATDMVVPGGQLQTACASGSFSFTLGKVASGTYNLDVLARDESTNLSSSAVAISWKMDALVPADPTLVTPGRSPYTSGSGTLDLSGGCEPGATVYLNGASQQDVACQDSQYTFQVSKSSDGSFDFEIHQVDTAGNASGRVTLQWILDTSMPATPVLTSPASSVVINAASTLQIAGSCQDNALVRISGDVAASDMITPAGQLTVTCVSSQFALTLGKSMNGVFDLSLTQTSPSNGFTSAASSIQWTRDTQAPASPVLTSPASNPYLSGGSQITLAGSCETGSAVSLTDDATGSVVCDSSAFQFTVNASADGTYHYIVKQTDAAGNASPDLELSWTRDASVPPAPTITSPASGMLVSNASSLTIAGACLSGYTVNLGGDVSASEVTSPSQSRSQVCVDSSYGFTLSKASDNTYSLTVDQIHPVNSNRSAKTTLIWQRDSMSPRPVVITSPASNPMTSGDTNLSIQGTCETGSVVRLAGANTAEQNCVNESFSFLVSKSVDNSYNYTLTQMDSASNVATATEFQWIRDTSIPETPGIALPAVSPYISNASTLTISGSCTDTYTVTLGGGVVSSDITSPAGSLTTVCANSSYSFTVRKTVDATYEITVVQTSLALQDSAQNVLKWIRDTVAPAAPTRTQPTVNPYSSSGVMTLAGACETKALVYLTGSSSQSMSCATGSYAFSIASAADGNFSYAVHQIDAAGNTSGSITQDWVKDSSTPPTPSITAPASNPYTSNASSFTLAGGCQPGYVLTLGGNVLSSEVLDPAGSLSQVCSNSGAYTYVIAKSSDGTFNFTVKAANGSLESGLAQQSWIRDSVGPTVTLLTTPSHPNLQLTTTITFSADDPGTQFECRLDSAAYSGCTSPVSLANISNALHTFYVRGTDSAGNVGTAKTASWSQEAYSTIALYHFTSGSALLDGSLYTGTERNDLTQTGTTVDTGSSWSGDSRRFTASANSFCSSVDNKSQDLLVEKMTLEAFVKFQSLPSSSSVALMTKSGTSGNYGWEFRIKKQGNSYALVLAVSTNGVTLKEVKSTTFPLQSVASATYQHLAVTWDKGTVKFYVDGVAKGSAAIGTAGATVIFKSTAPLRLGIAEGSLYPLDASMDAVRLSQSIRWTGSFTKPSSAYTAD